jgi:putative tryptophan/tyrosine transport system substrate-binding protein
MNRRGLLTLIPVAAIAWPRAARAQQPMPSIGYLSVGSQESDIFRLDAFRRGLGEIGYVEGQNFAVEYAWAKGEYDRLPALAADLVRHQVAAIVAGGAPPAFAAKAATATIPIIFAQGVDPVQSGLVASLNRPGGNITGVVNLSLDLVAKRLELLHELLPSTAAVALLVNPANPATEGAIGEAQNAAHSLGLQLHSLPATSSNEIDAAFETLVRLGASGLVVYGDPFFTNQRLQIVALAARHTVPAIYEWRLFPVAGGLMSYGTDIADSWRQAGIYTGKILNGAKPADLPVQQVVKIELVINLQTAKSLRLTIPLPLLGRADEVIE